MRMHRPTHLHPRLLILVAALALAACGGEAATDQTSPAADVTETTNSQPEAGSEMDDMSDGDMTESDTDDMAMDDDMDMSGDYGEPADPSEADRVIEVSVDNDFAFDPAEFEVAAGEVITFRVSNTGDIEHEFVLGDEEAQKEMGEMMDGGDDHAHSGEMSNALTIHAGETGELTWRFASPGTVLIGCHVPGHYEAGMKGTVTVTE